jgi:hypothetical protein
MRPNFLGGPGWREENFANHAGHRFAKLSGYVGFDLTGGGQNINNKTFTTLGATSFPHTVNTVGAAGLNTRSMPMPMALDVSIQTANLSPAVTRGPFIIELYGLNLWGVPVKDSVTITSVANNNTARVSGSVIFARLTAVRIVQATAAVGADSIGVGPRLFVSGLANATPVFGVPIHIASANDIVHCQVHAMGGLIRFNTSSPAPSLTIGATYQIRDAATSSFGKSEFQVVSQSGLTVVGTGFTGGFVAGDTLFNGASSLSAAVATPINLMTNFGQSRTWDFLNPNQRTLAFPRVFTVNLKQQSIRLEPGLSLTGAVVNGQEPVAWSDSQMRYLVEIGVRTTRGLRHDR